MNFLTTYCLLVFLDPNLLYFDDFFFRNYRDVAIILSTTNFWPNRTAEDITVEEYTGLINSHVLSNISSQLKNCSLENELNAAAGGTGLAFIGKYCTMLKKLSKCEVKA